MHRGSIFVNMLRVRERNCNYMSSSRMSDIAVALFVMILSVAVFLFTFTFPENHRSVGVASFPRLMNVIMVALAGMLLWQVGAKGRIASRPTEESPVLWNRRTLVPIFIVSLMIAGYVVLLRPLGFLITSVLFLGSSIFYFGERNVLRLLIVSIGITAVVYLFFGVLAGVPFPLGTLFRGF